MSNLKIGPSQSTPRKSGVVNVSCELPGVISFSCDDPNVTLGASSHTVGGSVSHFCQTCGPVGAAAINKSALALVSGFTLACEIRLPTGNKIAMAGILANSSKAGAGWNFALYNTTPLKLTAYQHGGSPAGAAFSYTFTGDTWTKCVLIFASTYIRLITPTSDQTINRTAPAGVYSGTPSFRTCHYGASSVQASAQLRNLEMLGSIASTEQINSYLAGTKLAASSSLILDVPFQEESGDIFYDRSPTAADFTKETYDAASNFGQMFLNPRFSEWASALSDSEYALTWSVPADYEPGSFTITASRTRAGFPSSIATETDTCTITISAVDVVGISLDKAEIEVEIGSSETITATVWPPDATETGVSWSSSNMGVATVLSGVVTGTGRGSCVITAETVDGSFTASCAVTVPAAAPVFGDVAENTMADLLPRALREEYISRAWADTIEARTTDTGGLIDLLDNGLVYDVASQSSAVLDAVADSLGIFGWEFGASLTEKRAFLAKALEIQRKIGTPWAIEQAIRLVIPAAWLGTITITEGTGGWTFDGSVDFDGSHYYDSAYHWAKFTVDVAFIAATGREAALETMRTELEAVINHYKPVRCQLFSLNFNELGA